MSQAKAIRKALADIREQLPELASRAAVAYVNTNWRWAGLDHPPGIKEIIRVAESLLDAAPATVDDFWFTAVGGLHLYVAICGDEVMAEMVCGPSAAGQRRIKKGKRQ